jgi:hypothetical protein
MALPLTPVSDKTNDVASTLLMTTCINVDSRWLLRSHGYLGSARSREAV